MMGSFTFYLFMFMRLLFSLTTGFHHFPLIVAADQYSSSNFKQQPLILCHDDEKSALLQFNQSFLIDENASDDPSSYPKTASWKLNSNETSTSTSDCCSWDGVLCDVNTGHVIGLDLSSSFLYGSLNSTSTLFRLLRLQNLNLADNDFNYSQIPSAIGRLSTLTYLNLSHSIFSGQIPSQISELSKLASLDLCCNVGSYSGENLLKLEKPNLNSLLTNLTDLKVLNLSDVNISSAVPHILANFSSLTSLRLEDCGLHGEFPISIFQLPNLQTLRLSYNPYLSGYLPPEFNKSSPLKLLSIAGTSFSGKLPYSIGNLNSLEYLHMPHCNFSGSVPSSLGNLTQLIILDILSNNFNRGTLAWLGKQTKLAVLSVAEINLFGDIPSSLGNMTQLSILDLSNNQLTGQIPSWLGNLTQLHVLSLATNNLHGPIHGPILTGFNQPPTILPWTSLQTLDLQSNMLQGSLPIPPLSTLHYSISDNLLIGEISPLICNLTSLQILDLSNNNLSGKLPQCLGNFGNSFSMLNLRNNSFRGIIPQICSNGSKLRIIELGGNKLQGQLPRSLANCKLLEIIDLGNNEINDTFPSWLGSFPKLRVLILRSNKFHGVMRSNEAKFESPELHIIDLSCNTFTGTLPFEYFKNWNAMKSTVNMDHLSYMQLNSSLALSSTIFWSVTYNSTITITNKGTERIYEKIPEIFEIIDLSGNKFEGDIPESIGNLKGIQLLNLSNNILTGPIPSWLANLTSLESLDLSQNKFSGEIPPQLTGLTFLAVFNVSHNHLKGPIPQGKQFNTFENSSFKGNSGLCGKPLSNKCENSVSISPPLTSEQGKESKFPSGYDWIFIVAGYGSGLVVGLVIGHIFTSRKHIWFVETFGRRPQKKQRGSRNRN